MPRLYHMNIVDLENKGVYITWDNITTTDENIPCKHNSYENQIFIAFFFTVYLNNIFSFH